MTTGESCIKGCSRLRATNQAWHLGCMPYPLDRMVMPSVGQARRLAGIWSEVLPGLHEGVTAPFTTTLRSAMSCCAVCRIENLYQHIFPPELAPSISFVGLPWKVVPFAQYELQAKWIARVLSGRARLPSRQKMHAHIQAFYKELELNQVPKRCDSMGMANGAHSNAQQIANWVRLPSPNAGLSVSDQLYALSTQLGPTLCCSAMPGEDSQCLLMCWLVCSQVYTHAGRQAVGVQRLAGRRLWRCGEIA